MRVAILEDDIPFCDDLARSVTAMGHTPITAYSGEEMMRHLRKRAVDVVLLDWEVADISGFNVLKWARGHLRPTPPIIMISMRTSEQDIIAALEEGADDYITKPINDSVLQARLKAHLRRTEGDRTDSAVEVYGAYAFDTETNTITIDGKKRPAAPREFDLALFFFRNLNRPVARRDIMQMVWSKNPDLPSRTLASHVAKLRLSLELRPERGYKLDSIYGYGYRLDELPETLAA